MSPTHDVGRDLVILVADKDMEAALKGLLSRTIALGCREIDYEPYVHIERDPGCLRNSHTFLRPMVKHFEHALVVFDHQGCGREQTDSQELERQVEDNLAANGWGERARAICLVPELEAWVWSASPHVPSVLGWSHNSDTLREWLVEHGWWSPAEPKPTKPKEAMEAVLRVTGLPRSSSVYCRLAERVSLGPCQDSGFMKLQGTLQEWFPPC